MKKVIICILLLMLISGCSNKANEMEIKTITSQEAIELMEKENDYVIVDVRTIEEYESGHIEKAINIPIETINDEPSELPDKNQLIMIYCRSGNRSAKAAKLLKDLGYKNIIDFGGINTWPKDLVKD